MLSLPSGTLLGYLVLSAKVTPTVPLLGKLGPSGTVRIQASCQEPAFFPQKGKTYEIYSSRGFDEVTMASFLNGFTDAYSSADGFIAQRLADSLLPRIPSSVTCVYQTSPYQLLFLAAKETELNLYGLSSPQAEILAFSNLHQADFHNLLTEHPTQYFSYRMLSLDKPAAIPISRVLYKWNKWKSAKGFDSLQKFSALERYIMRT